MRGLIEPELRKRYPDARIVHELGLRYSTRRIDMAAIRPAQIICVEIKSSRDVADRLEAQLRAFVPVATRIIVALAPVWNERLDPVRHDHMDRRGRVVGSWQEPRLTRPQATIRALQCGWIETWTCDPDQACIAVTEPAWHSNVAPWALACLDLLHVAELAEIAVRHRIDHTGTHAVLVHRCADMLEGRQVMPAVCRALRTRSAFAQGSDAPLEVA